MKNMSLMLQKSEMSKILKTVIVFCHISLFPGYQLRGVGVNQIVDKLYFMPYEWEINLDTLKYRAPAPVLLFFFSLQCFYFAFYLS